MTESPEDLSDRELERRLKLGRMGHFAESIDERRDLGESWRERAECISGAPEREALEFIRKRPEVALRISLAAYLDDDESAR